MVEDDHDLRELICLYFTEAGYNMLAARNGKEAIAILMEHKPHPDLMILDMMMPVMTGWDVLEECQRTNLCDMPVIVLSAAPSNLQVHAEWKQVKAYIPKPCLMLDLQKVIITLIG